MKVWHWDMRGFWDSTVTSESACRCLGCAGLERECLLLRDSECWLLRPGSGRQLNADVQTGRVWCDSLGQR